MSASGYKRTFRGQLANVRFTPKSGHSNGVNLDSDLWMSALPPRADIGEGIAECPLMTQSGHT